MKYDAIVIGYGPCGITTAIYLKRFGYNVAVIGKDRGALEKPTTIENYYGIPSISGHDLIDLGVKQAKDLEIPVYEDEVLEVSYGSPFNVKTTKEEFTADVVMLSMGKSRARHPLATQFEGQGVSYCATCDGFFYRKKKIGILGNSNFMLEELNVLKNLTSDITIFTDGKEFSQEVEFPVVKDKIIAFVGDEQGLNAIKTAKDTYPLQGCFMAIGSASGFSLASHLGLAIEKEDLIVNDDFMTNIPGIFAGGDCIGGLLQISKAVGDGANAAMGIRRYLLQQKK